MRSCDERPWQTGRQAGAGHRRQPWVGAAIARRLASEGAAVAINYVANASAANALVSELKAKGAQAAAFRADVAERAQIKGLVAQVVDTFGGLDILASNAGVELHLAVGC